MVLEGLRGTSQREQMRQSRKRRCHPFAVRRHLALVVRQTIRILAGSSVPTNIGEEDSMSLAETTWWRLGRLAGATLLLAIFLAPVSARAEDDAKHILKAMSDYMAGQMNFSVVYDSDIEVITPDLQKIQFASSGQMRVSRPDKMQASRMGGYSDVELFLDGKTLTIFGKDRNAYAQGDAPGSIDQTIDFLRNDYGTEMPGADLVLSNVYDALIDGVLDAKHIGEGVVDGVECEHLAFRNQDTDWQIWIEKGDRPIPRKYVITSKAVTSGPQYTLRIREWNEEQAPAGAFTFTPPADAKKVDFKELSAMDEVPEGAVVGESK
jgi:hypothetical protein